MIFFLSTFFFIEGDINEQNDTQNVGLRGVGDAW